MISSLNLIGLVPMADSAPVLSEGGLNMKYAGYCLFFLYICLLAGSGSKIGSKSFQMNEMNTR